MKKRIVLLFLALLTLPSYAASWVDIGGDEYIDTSSVAPYENDINSDVKYSFSIKALNNKSANFLYLEKSYKTEFKYQITDYIVNCSTMKIATKDSKAYDKQDNMVHQYSAPYLQFVDVVPDAKTGKYFSYLCANKAE